MTILRRLHLLASGVTPLLLGVPLLAGPPRPVPASSPVLFDAFWPDRPVWTSLANTEGPDLLVATCAGGPVRLRGEVAAPASDSGPGSGSGSGTPVAEGPSCLAIVTESPLADLGFARGLVIDARGDGRTYRLLLESERTPVENPPATPDRRDEDPEGARPTAVDPGRQWYGLEIRPPAERWTRFVLPFGAFRPIDGDPSRGIVLSPDRLVATRAVDEAMAAAVGRRVVRLGAAIDRSEPGRFRLEIARIALLDPSRTEEDDVEVPTVRPPGSAAAE